MHSLPEGSVHSNEVPLLEQNMNHSASASTAAALPMGSTDAPQPQHQQILMVAQPQPVQYVASFQPGPDPTNEEQENYLYSNRTSDLTICHWLACLFCNCCGCAFVAFILNEMVGSAKKAGAYKLAFFMSKRAKCWMTVACVCTLIPWIILMIMWSIYGTNGAREYIGEQLNDLTNNGTN